MAKRDYYEILGVARDVDNQRRSSRPTASSRCSTTRTAIRTIRPRRRVSRKPPRPTPCSPIGGEARALRPVRARGRRRGRAGGFGFDPSAFGDLSDLFGEIFGFASAGPAAARREEATCSTRWRSVSRRGLRRRGARFLLSRLETCETCSGSGAEAGSRPKPCSVCRGTGRQRFSQGFLTVARPCGNCRGEGTIIEKPCADCRGDGRKRRAEISRSAFPPGSSRARGCASRERATPGPTAAPPAIST